MRFEHRRLTVDAMPIAEVVRIAGIDGENWQQLPQWLIDSCDDGDILFIGGGMGIEDPHGELRAYPPDYVIKGLFGELYLCEASLFDLLYAPLALPASSSHP